MLGFGMLMSLYIPMNPFIVWVGACIAWFITIAEALLSVPLWGLAHMDSEGEGLGQRTSHGYLYMLNVLFRPALMVIGFLVAGAGIIVLGSFVHNMYGIVIASIQADGSAMGSFTGVASIVGFIIIYCVLMNSVIHGCFNAIHLIPDQVLAWVGGHGDGGHFGRDVAGSTTNAVGGVINRASGAGGRIAMPSPKGNQGSLNGEHNPSLPAGPGGPSTTTTQ